MSKQKKAFAEAKREQACLELDVRIALVVELEAHPMDVENDLEKMALQKRIAETK